MSSQVVAVIILGAACGLLSYFSFRRTRDIALAASVAIAIFFAFLAGSLIHPVALTPKKASRELAIAEQVGDTSRSAVPLEQQALDNLPNITLPAIGNIDVAGVQRAGSLSISRVPVLSAGESVELRGWVADPVAHDKAGGLFVIVNDSSRINVSSGYGIDRPDVAATLKNPQLEDTGFDVTIPASAFRPGKDEVQLGVIAADQRGFFKFPDRVTVQVNER
jgi:hypothetical protein